MKKHLTFLLTLFLAACIAALFLSFIVFKIIYPHTIRPSGSVSITSAASGVGYYGVGMHPAPAEQTALKVSLVANLFGPQSVPKQPIKFLFFGDIMLDRHVKDKINQNGFNYLLEKLAGGEKRFFQGADVIGANLEGAVTAGGKHYPPEISIDFAFNPDDVAQLKNYGFNFFNIANNHILDQGQTGLLETQKNLEGLGFQYVGCPDRQIGECSIKILDIKDIKVALLSYSMVYGTLDENKVAEQIKAAKQETDLVVVFMHWGVEYEQEARSNQVALAHKMIDAGADVIIGSHPHVVQEMEIYNNKPIFYSLGNFIFDQYFSRETQEGMAVGLTVDNGKMEVTLLPFKSKASQVELMSGQDKERFLAWLAEESKVNEEDREQIKQGSIIIY